MLEQSYILTTFLNKLSEQRRIMKMTGRTSKAMAWLFGGIVILACMYLMMNFIAHPIVLEIA
jgi:hypothetical protein